MRAALVALMLLVSAQVADAQENVRGVCLGGGLFGQGQVTTPAAECILRSPGEYSGGDTIYFRSFVPAMFTTTIPHGRLTYAVSGINPYALADAAKTIVSCTQLKNLALGTDSFIAPVPNEGTLAKAWCITSGTIVTSPTAHLAECSSSGASCGDNTGSALTCDADGDSTTTFSGAGGTIIDANDWMQFDLTNTPSVTDGVTTFCFSYVPN